MPNDVTVYIAVFAAGAVVGAPLWNWLMRKLGVPDMGAIDSNVKQSFALAEQAMAQQAAQQKMAEETLGLSREHVAQGEETVALLRAINENLSHRTIKN